VTTAAAVNLSSAFGSTSEQPTSSICLPLMSGAPTAMTAPGATPGIDLPVPGADCPPVEAVAAAAASAAVTAAAEGGREGELKAAAVEAVAPAPEGGRSGQARIGPYTLGRTLGTGSTCTLNCAVRWFVGVAVLPWQDCVGQC